MWTGSRNLWRSSCTRRSPSGRAETARPVLRRGRGAPRAGARLVGLAALWSLLPLAAGHARDESEPGRPPVSSGEPGSEPASFSAEARRFFAIAGSVPLTAVEREAYSAVAAPGAPGFRSVPPRGSSLVESPGPAPDPPRLALPPPRKLLATVPPPEAVGDKDRLFEGLGLMRESLLRPYEQSTVKGDRPVFGEDWYLRFGLDAVTTVEAGRFGSLLGASREDSGILVRQAISPALSLIRGGTVFRPPDWQLRVRATASASPAESLAARFESGRADASMRRDLALDELYVERHLRTLSDRYDFQSVRIGVQPFISDFRGFLLNDSQPAVRWFGNAQNNTRQYNVVWMRRLQKDPVSGGNTGELRDEDVIAANLYLQDMPWLGFQVQGTAVYHRDRGGPASDVDPEDRADHDVVYLGLSGDGHVDRMNLTFSGYTALGRDRRAAGGRSSLDVRAHFFALESSVDFDWVRLKAYGVYASGDGDPTDGRSEGFDTVSDRPVFGGAEDGFLQRESLPVSGSGLLLTTRGGLLPSLRFAHDRDSAHFANPGCRLIGIGADLDVLPELRMRLNASWRAFDDTSSLEALSGGRSVSGHLGEDYSLALIYRPWLSNNVVVRASAAAFRAGDGLLDLLGAPDERGTLYSTRVELVLSY